MDTTTYPQMRGEIFTSGYDGRYRIWTVNEVPFGRFPRYDAGGPSMVVLDDFAKSVSYLNRFFSSPSVAEADDGKVTLNLRRITGRSASGLPETKPHELNGTKYSTMEEADRAAYEAGCTGYMLYVVNEARYGL